MYIKIEEGTVGMKSISFVKDEKETYLATLEGGTWIASGPTSSVTLYDYCQVCTAEELWTALSKIAEDKVWTPI